MAVRRTGRPERIVTLGLLVQRIPIHEADLMLTLFTEQVGKISAMARSARRSHRRFAGLEPIHRMRLTLERRPGKEVWTLVESSIDRPRLRATERLDRLEASGRALAWIRRGVRSAPEPAVWAALDELLDALEETPNSLQSQVRLVGFGLRLLDELGWGLELERCVGCGKTCRPGESSRIDPQRGGLVCRACGGGPRALSSSLRYALIAARSGDFTVAADALDATVACALVDETLALHAS